MKRLFTALAATLFLTIIPYAFFIKFFVLRGVPSLIDLVPDTFQSIQSSSSSLLHQLTFDLGSVTDNFLIGQYVTKTPRTGKLFYTLIAILPFFITIPSKPRSQHRLRMLLTLLLGPLRFDVVRFGIHRCAIGFHVPRNARGIVQQALPHQIALRGNDGQPHCGIYTRLAIPASIPIHLSRHCQHSAASGHCHTPPMSGADFNDIPAQVEILDDQCFRGDLLLSSPRTGKSFALLSGNMGGLIRPYNLQNIREISTLSSLPVTE